MIYAIALHIDGLCLFLCDDDERGGGDVDFINGLGFTSHILYAIASHVPFHSCAWSPAFSPQFPEAMDFIPLREGQMTATCLGDFCHSRLCVGFQVYLFTLLIGTVGSGARSACVRSTCWRYRGSSWSRLWV